MADVESRRADFIEGLFAGIVSAVYNAIYSCALLMHRPFRGVWRLSARRALADVPQLAPQTLIFALFVCIDSFVLRTSADVSPALRQFVRHGNAPAEISEIVAKALVQTVVVDVFCRLVGWWLHRVDRRRRTRFVVLILYAVSGALAWVVVLWIVAVHWLVHASGPIFRGGKTIVYVLSFAAAIPVALQISAEVRRGRKRRVSPLGVTVVAFIAVVGCFMLAQEARSVVDDVLTEPRHPLDLQCEIRQDGSIFATMVVENASRERLTFRPDDLSIMFSSSATGVLVLPARILESADGQDRPIYGIPVGEVSWFRIQSQPAAVLRGALPRLRQSLADARCTVPPFDEGGDAWSLGLVTMRRESPAQHFDRGLTSR